MLIKFCIIKHRLLIEPAIVPGELILMKVFTFYNKCFQTASCLKNVFIKLYHFFTQCNWCRDSAKTLIQDSVSNDQWVGQELGTRQTNVIPLLFQNLKRNPKSEKANARTLETKHSKKIELLQIISLLLCEWLSQKPFSLVFLCIFIFNK